MLGNNDLNKNHVFLLKIFVAIKAKTLALIKFKGMENEENYLYAISILYI